MRRPIDGMMSRGTIRDPRQIDLEWFIAELLLRMAEAAMTKGQPPPTDHSTC